MYRSRLKGKLDKDVLKYLSSIDDDSAILYYDIIGSQAHAIMLYEQGLINKVEQKKILGALEDAKKKDLTKFLNVYEDIHEALEAFVVQKAGIDIGGKMHTARSRNDQVALDIRMKVRDDTNNISIHILELVNTLLLQASKNVDAIMPMYTHLQQAQIGTFSHYLLSYADVLLRDLERLDGCYERIKKSPLGAVAIGGTSLEINRKKVASLLAFDGIVENSIDATTSRDVLIEFCFSLASVMISLSRIAEDFILWSTSEFNYIELADEVTSSSSVMPQKKNPCPLELMRAKAAYVIGLLFSIMATVKALPSGYSRDLQDAKRILFQAGSVTNDSLIVMNAVVQTLRTNKKVMLKSAERSYAVSLDVAEGLVRSGMAFREAHKVVGELVRHASGKSKTLQDLTDTEIVETVGKELAPHVKKMLKVINPKQSVHLRVSAGSPNQKEQERMINDRKLYVKKRSIDIEKRIEHVSKTFKNLEKLVKSNR